MTPTTMIATMTIATMMTKVVREKKYRNELKIHLNTADEIILRSRLSRVFKPDPHADSHGNYRVSSLYFDTAEDQALQEKIAGLEVRHKYRLRYYGNDLDFIRLEKKSKYGSVGQKRQSKVTVEQVRKILKGDLAWMLDTNDALLLELYTLMCHKGLRPRSITQYDRSAYAFEAGNVRLTIDRNLHVSWDPEDFLHPEKKLFPTGDPALLEVKFDEFLPDFVRNLVGLANRRVSANSKYAASRRYD